MNRRALTLVEMIEGLVIMAIIAATILVSYGMVERRKLDTESRNLVADLTWVREMAASTHHNYTLEFNTTTDTYRVYNESVAPANLIKQKKLGVDLSSVTDFSGNTETQLTFSTPKGEAEERIINLTQQGRFRNVRVFPGTGYAKIE
jgi:Tfp pilus assembly protein FimT